MEMVRQAAVAVLGVQEMPWGVAKAPALLMAEPEAVEGTELAAQATEAMLEVAAVVLEVVVIHECDT
jgi:hypothetical protein